MYSVFPLTLPARDETLTADEWNNSLFWFWTALGLEDKQDLKSRCKYTQDAPDTSSGKTAAEENADAFGVTQMEISFVVWM